MSIILSKRMQQAAFELAASANRNSGSGGGSGLIAISSGGFFAGGALGGYSTANSTSWTDITNTSFQFAIARPMFFEYRLVATAHISAGAGTGYIRGSIVGFDNTASPYFVGANATNGPMWYYPPAPIQPGTYTAKLQAATDNNVTTITVDQVFHQIFLHSPS